MPFRWYYLFSSLFCIQILIIWAQVCTKGNRLVTKNHENSPEIKVIQLNSSHVLTYLLSIGNSEQLGEGMGVTPERVQSYIPRPRRGTWHPWLQQWGLKGEFGHRRWTTGSKNMFSRWKPGSARRSCWWARATWGRTMSTAWSSSGSSTMLEVALQEALTKRGLIRYSRHVWSYNMEWFLTTWCLDGSQALHGSR